jgi:hypothetical protein
MLAYSIRSDLIKYLELLNRYWRHRTTPLSPIQSTATASSSRVEVVSPVTSTRCPELL